MARHQLTGPVWVDLPMSNAHCASRITRHARRSAAENALQAATRATLIRALRWLARWLPGGGVPDA